MRRLHIGGKYAVEGWEVFDAIPNEFVNHVGDAGDLSRFDEGAFAELYASHVLEHFDYNGAMQTALKEWFRVLEHGGKILLSVPDMDVLAGLYVNKSLSIADRFIVMRMMFGGHIDKYDYHYVGLNFELLADMLTRTGFVNITKVSALNIFHDTSESQISLNVIAEKP